MPSDPIRFRLRATGVPPATADVVVVGAGVVGCATAFRAARAGFRTVVIDARPRPATLTTPAATGAYRLRFDNAEEVALVRRGSSSTARSPSGPRARRPPRRGPSAMTRRAGNPFRLDRPMTVGRHDVL